MENIGLIVIIAIFVVLIVLFIVGRAARKAKTHAPAHPGQEASASAEFSKRGH
jgi:hypothetical protein